MPVCAIEPFPILPHHERWIRTAIALTVERFHQDVENLLKGESFDDTWMSVNLPERYRHHYDAAFAKQFLDVTLAVVWKWESEKWWKLNSLAEELGMLAVLAEVEAVVEGEGRHFDIGELEDLIFEDTDFELLFVPKWDGIEDDEAFERVHGVENLSFRNWFKPFSEWKGCYSAVEPPESSTSDPGHHMP